MTVGLLDDLIGAVLPKEGESTVSFASVYTKSQDGAFRQRFAVALMEQARWELQRAKLGGESDARFAERQGHARTVRARITNADWLTRWAIYCLLPWESYDPDNDAELQAKVASVFLELADAEFTTP